MIHIASPHTSGQWIDIQRRFLEEHTQEEFLFYTRGAPFPHGANLDLLAREISQQANPSDLIVFMDGDAFPIQPWTETTYSLLEYYPMVAVRRLETSANEHPHPCFTVTSVRFWQELGGSWLPGPVKRGKDGRSKMDVGGLLKVQLERAGIEWASITRMTKPGIHHRMLSVYGLPKYDLPMIYHHGAGFRPPNFADDGPNPPIAANQALSEKWYEKIQSDPNFWKELV